ncbi:hypothetical protein STRCR_0845 [Streptococcus criceti HS-6]|uniref:Uncharacterized protein n=1 Tax=Streptococcus criceti HS-6 TaxID=873449 RepID=G5JS67_STRCG|nr:hypothetical protein STRCR_0845 [Streptococcus criceti HS-6]
MSQHNTNSRYYAVFSHWLTDETTINASSIKIPQSQNYLKLKSNSHSTVALST